MQEIVINTPRSDIIHRHHDDIISTVHRIETAREHNILINILIYYSFSCVRTLHIAVSKYIFYFKGLPRGVVESSSYEVRVQAQRCGVAIFILWHGEVSGIQTPVSVVQLTSRGASVSITTAAVAAAVVVIALFFQISSSWRGDRLSGREHNIGSADDPTLVQCAYHN